MELKLAGPFAQHRGPGSAPPLTAGNERAVAKQRRPVHRQNPVERDVQARDDRERAAHRVLDTTP